ncbi:hypothetical protein [Nocardia sp. NPDC004722]
MMGRGLRRGNGALVAVVALGLLLIGVGWWGYQPAGHDSHRLGSGASFDECLCTAPPTPQQLAAVSNLVVVGAISARPTPAAGGGVDYILRVSRVLLSPSTDAVTEVTVHVSGRTGCCAHDGPIPLNAEQVLFLARRDPDTFTVTEAGWGRMPVRDNTVSYYTDTSQYAAETLDELAAQIAAPDPRGMNTPHG